MTWLTTTNWPVLCLQTWPDWIQQADQVKCCLQPQQCFQHGRGETRTSPTARCPRYVLENICKDFIFCLKLYFTPLFIYLLFY